MTAQSSLDWRQPRALAWYKVGSETLKAVVMSRDGDRCTMQVFVTFKDLFNTPITRSYVATVAANKLKKRVE